jgi:hypothetical protein
MSLRDVKTGEIPLFHIRTEEYKCVTHQRVTLLFVDWGTSKAEYSYSYQIQSSGHTNKFLTKESKNAMTTVITRGFCKKFKDFFRLPIMKYRFIFTPLQNVRWTLCSYYDNLLKNTCSFH